MDDGYEPQSEEAKRGIRDYDPDKMMNHNDKDPRMSKRRWYLDERMTELNELYNLQDCIQKVYCRTIHQFYVGKVSRPDSNNMDNDELEKALRAQRKKVKDLCISLAKIV